MQGGSAYPTSDLYSLGATCFHLLSGIHPYYVEAWKDFGDRAGWRVKGEWIKYGSLKGINFSTEAPSGHLPYEAHLTMGARRFNDLGFFPRTYSCNL